MRPRALSGPGSWRSWKGKWAGVIADPPLFRLAAYLSGKSRRLQAGEYSFGGGESAEAVMNRLVAGITMARRLTVAEGLTTAQVLQQLEAADGLEGAITERPAEGEVLPSTYFYSHGDSRNELVRRMRAEMRRTLEELWSARAPGHPLARPEEALILASIVERETSREDERARVAAVFLNRLKRGMPLQADPTVAYAITGGRRPLDRSLTTTDLGLDSPYNTYLSRGLPPGPIANPGMAALLAVLHPSSSDELYFVADGTGGHAFGRTLDEHEKNVARLRRVRLERGASEKP